MLPDLPPDIEACLDSTTCILGVSLTAVVPALVLVAAALNVLGVEKPKISIFTEFVTEDDCAAVEAEEAAMGTKPKAAPVPDPDVPTERSSLLPRSNGPITRPDAWRQITLTALAVLEVVGWTMATVVRATHLHPSHVGIFGLVITVAALASWVYAALRPSIRPSRTPYYDLFSIYFSHLLAASVALYEASTTTTGDIGLSFGRLGHVVNALVTFAGVVVILGMPLTTAPKGEVDEDGHLPALEDHATLWQWITFTWMSPLITIGTVRPLEEKDVWQLSKTMRTRVLMRKFLQVRRSSLLRRLLVANAMDLFLDGTLTFLSTAMNFSAPFFLNLTLRAMTDTQVSTTSANFSNYSIKDNLHFYYSVSLDSVLLPTMLRASPPGQMSINTVASGRTLQRSDAYFFAIAAFVCQVIKSQSDLQHLYFGRRASVRTKAELVASVYEKALKRKDVTGAVQKQEKDVKGKGKEQKPDAPQDSSSADVGKIVSLIAADSERVSRFISFGPFIYDAPISIIIACTMLYNLMGWTAFAGYIAMLFALPLNLLIVRRTSSFQRSVSAMRDRRMRAMNEAIQSIKFIKFSAWESRWINRVLDSRREELKWLRKLKVSFFFLGLMWDVVPILVSAISFSCFTLVAKRELTVDIAFPCITVFGMLSQSLTALPMIANMFVMSAVALKRIEKYLNEEDVPEHVSSLTRAAPAPHEPIDTRLGCSAATFRWPSLPAEDDKDKNKDKNKSGVFAKIGAVWGALTGFIGRVLVLLRLKKKTEEQPKDEPVEETADKPFELSDIDVVFPEGVISLVSGPTGSGKSSLLAALLGEMDRVEGEQYLPKEPTRLNEKTGLPMTISYCAQQPWLEHKSIKDNILFGSPYDKERYEATLSCCALLPDLAILDDGDLTEIGEKGVSLSGGQKARVALARAVYARTQFVLMDDVLSAVDSHTAELIVKKCFLGPLMKHRTVVLVTHHVDLVLPAVAWVVKLFEGRIETQGTVAQLRESGALLAVRAGQKEIELTEETTTVTDGEAQAIGVKDGNQATKKLVEDEKKSTGAVKLAVYQTYLSAASYWLFSFLVMLLFADEIFKVVQKFWIKRWSESYDSYPANVVHVSRDWLDFGFPSASQNVLPYLLVYVGIQALSSMTNILNQVPSIMSTLRASRLLYERMLRSVMRSPSRFFDKTPSGRILNRFSKDVDTIDGGLQDFMLQVIMQITGLVVAVGTICYAVPFFIVPACVIAYIHLWFARGYVNTTRDLRRIESNTRSPIVSSFGELVVGIVTVRAFGSEKAFLSNLYRKLDKTQAATHYFWMCNRWLLFRFDTLGAFSVLIATTGSLVGGASAGLAGIVIVQAQQYVRGLYWGLRFWTELEQSLNSVERVQEYLDLPSEPPAIIESSRPPAAWPSATKGTLVVEDLELKYSPELEPVLKGISFETKPAERIGIVGRTGSGKSTLALALFRFVDPAAGRIILDGIDITSIGLDDLRSRLTLIPQDAVLFNGTIRENLDPFNEYTDAECIEALQRVHLRTTDTPGLSAATSRAASIKDGVTTPMLTGVLQPDDVDHDGAQGTVTVPERHSSEDSETLVPTTASIAPSTPGGTGSGRTVFTLETKVSEGGNNFSQGQRQLLSMARALLRKSSVIVMDESTASVDFETDAKIQTTIREEFNQSILLTIAHRLRTIIDNDRILVLSAGRVVEFDTPSNLLKKADGVFHEMCKKSGDYDELLKMAEDKTRRADA